MKNRAKQPYSKVRTAQHDAELKRFAPTLYDRKYSGLGGVITPEAARQNMESLIYGSDKAIGEGIFHKALTSGDHVAINLIYEAAKIEAAKKGMTGDDALAWAGKHATDVVMQTQVSSDVAAMSGFSRYAKEHPLGLLFVMFTNESSKAANILAQSYIKMRQSRYVGNGKQATFDFIKTVAVVGIAETVMIQTLRRTLGSAWGLFTRKDDQDWADEFFGWFFNTMGNVQAYGQGLQMASQQVYSYYKGRRYATETGNLAGDLALDAQEATVALLKAIDDVKSGDVHDEYWRENEKKFRGSLARLMDKATGPAGVVFKMPFSGFWKPIRGGLVRTGVIPSGDNPTLHYPRLMTAGLKGDDSRIEKELRILYGMGAQWSNVYSSMQARKLPQSVQDRISAIDDKIRGWNRNQPVGTPVYAD